MRTIAVLGFTTCFLLSTFIAHAKPSPLLVSSAWLAQHLNDKDLVILHADWVSWSYKSEHIPGARFLWISSLAPSFPDHSTELPTLEEAQSVLKGLGITEQSRIIVYFTRQNITMTTRILLTLEYFGLGDHISLLDGGIDTWKQEGRPVTQEIPAVAPGSFVPKLHPEIVVDAAWIQKNLTSSNVSIIDARAKRFFDGNGGGMPRAGHIPNAINIPFSDVVDSTNKLLDEKSLRVLFVTAGVKQGNEVVTYCHVGQQATLLYFVAKYLGYKVRLYDGSFEDWSSQLELPVVNPAEAAMKN